MRGVLLIFALSLVLEASSVLREWDGCHRNRRTGRETQNQSDCQNQEYRFSFSPLENSCGQQPEGCYNAEMQLVAKSCENFSRVRYALQPSSKEHEIASEPEFGVEFRVGRLAAP